MAKLESESLRKSITSNAPLSGLVEYLKRSILRLSTDLVSCCRVRADSVSLKTSPCHHCLSLARAHKATVSTPNHSVLLITNRRRTPSLPHRKTGFGQNDTPCTPLCAVTRLTESIDGTMSALWTLGKFRSVHAVVLGSTPTVWADRSLNRPSLHREEWGACGAGRRATRQCPYRPNSRHRA
jgi:hypothetical protein